ncbi:2-succinyl-6-hydroxy-2,4-cyclohexadiene-1-carboxylate synthase [Halobacillus litoralis]|uniref:2-succinyl-6-hydroxy-2, 4-cyclohexadiene-1-carboxylate synthase n=1 Tax=Halobacillus litoralis TaxID=45668 RepID=UPI001CFE6271|nr:2-succinyl-6-hydroxy-2,4-cyclohexadiene-1-carboxylate synthase [Halobacillus litoralis]
MMYEVGNRGYWVEEEGQGEPLLLLHGFTGSTKTFHSMLEHLTGNYRIIKIDLPGHGRTGSIGKVSMERFCRDLAALLEKMDITSVTLLGYSLGGRAALSFAMLYPLHVERIILESASPGLATTEEQLSRQAKDQALAGMVQKEGLESFVSYWENIPLFQSQSRLPDDAKKALRQERLNQTAEGLSNSLLGMGTGHQPSWWEQLPSLRQPVMLITGQEDRKFQLINQKMYEELPNASWQQVEDAGHTVHLEKPKIFAKIVDGFMIE